MAVRERHRDSVTFPEPYEQLMEESSIYTRPFLSTLSIKPVAPQQCYKSLTDVQTETHHTQHSCYKQKKRNLETPHDPSVSEGETRKTWYEIEPLTCAAERRGG